MKKFQMFVFTAILTFAITENLFGMSIGRDGASYLDNSIEWQEVSYKNDDAGFIASIPGSPSSGISGAMVYIYSEYQGVEYEIHSDLNDRYAPPKKERDFIKQLEEVFVCRGKVLPVASNQAKVKYIAEILHYEGNQITRVYCSKNCLYWAIVAGKDLSIAPIFFETIEITK